jgi:hypothetical protein
MQPPSQAPEETAESVHNSSVRSAARRNVYTREEKEEFERWITANPYPTKVEKAEYAAAHNITNSQLQNLINNRKRRKRSENTREVQNGNTSQISRQNLELSPCDSMTNPHNAIIELNDSDTTQLSASLEPHQDCSTVDTKSLGASEGKGSLAVPGAMFSETLKTLGKRASYSSIETYLKSTEEAVPYESIQVASKSFESLEWQESRPTSPHMASSFPARGREGPESFLAVPGSRVRQNSIDSDDHGSVDTAGTAGTAGTSFSVYSYTSSGSRYRAKKSRRRAYWEPDSVPFPCSFCDKTFAFRKSMVTHEINTHCLPQTFPCTFCQKTFDSIEKWEEHEADFHCQPQRTWFCMLDGDFRVQCCLFCDSYNSSRDHYQSAHNLTPCGLPLLSRTFSTRFEVLQHLIEVHGMSQHEISVVEDGIDGWGLNLNSSCSSGLWRCGYCNIVGADWDGRILHMKAHWADGGPRFTKTHPWSKIVQILGKHLSTIDTSNT